MGPQDPRLSRSAERERSAAKDRGIWGQYVAVCSVSNSPLTHNPFAALTQPLRIKCERYIFLKKCVCSSLCWLYFRLYMCIVVYVSWLWLCNRKTEVLYIQIFIFVFIFISIFIFRERERETVCVCVCVCARARAGERAYMSTCFYFFVWFFWQLSS